MSVGFWLLGAIPRTRSRCGTSPRWSNSATWADGFAGCEMRRTNTLPDRRVKPRRRQIPVCPDFSQRHPMEPRVLADRFPAGAATGRTSQRNRSDHRGDRPAGYWADVLRSLWRLVQVDERLACTL